MSRTRSTLSAGALAGGFLALAGGALTAHWAPATGYELNIYRATPLAFWAGVGAAFLVAAAVGLAPDTSRPFRALSLWLAGLAGLTITALPRIRGYYYYGEGDSLSHLGWTKLFANDALDPLAFLYPAIHTSSASVMAVTDMSARQSILVLLAVYFGVFLVFVPICVRAIVGTDRALMVGLLSALPVLPIGNVALYPNAHPATQAVLYLPLVLFVLFVYLTRGRADDSSRLPVTPEGALLGLASATMVLIHPQQAANLLAVFAFLSAIQFAVRRLWPDHAIAGHRVLYGQTLWLLVFFVVWSWGQRRVSSSLTYVIHSILAGGQIGESVGQRAGSLAQLGSSIEVLFLKLFGVAAVYCAIAALVMLASVSGRFDDRLPGHPVLFKYLSFAFVPVFGAFLVFFAANTEYMYLRYIGFIMVVVTILAAAALTTLASVSSGLSGRALRAVVAVALVVLIPVAMLSFFPSPYIYQANFQTTEQRLVGYENAFEHRDPDVHFVGVRGGPRRYIDVVYGTTYTTRTPGGKRFPGKFSAVPYRVFEKNLTTYYDRARYVPVTQRDRLREVVLYNGFRFSERGFRKLEATPGIDHVQANGGFDLYLVNGTNPPGATRVPSPGARSEPPPSNGTATTTAPPTTSTLTTTATPTTATTAGPNTTTGTNATTGTTTTTATTPSTPGSPSTPTTSPTTTTETTTTATTTATTTPTTTTTTTPTTTSTTTSPTTTTPTTTTTTTPTTTSTTTSTTSTTATTTTTTTTSTTTASPTTTTSTATATTETTETTTTPTTTTTTTTPTTTTTTASPTTTTTATTETTTTTTETTTATTETTETTTTTASSGTNTSETNASTMALPTVD